MLANKSRHRKGLPTPSEKYTPSVRSTRSLSLPLPITVALGLPFWCWVALSDTCSGMVQRRSFLTDTQSRLIATSLTRVGSKSLVLSVCQCRGLVSGRSIKWTASVRYDRHLTPRVFASTDSIDLIDLSLTALSHQVTLAFCKDQEALYERSMTSDMPHFDNSEQPPPYEANLIPAPGPLRALNSHPPDPIPLTRPCRTLTLPCVIPRKIPQIRPPPNHP
jgi:hypothetical protein